MTDQVILNQYKHKDSLAEVFQSVDIKFCLLDYKDGEYHQVHTPCKCRDFLADCVDNKIYGTDINVWGFRYDFKSLPYCTESTLVSLTFPSVRTKNYFIKNLPTLNILLQYKIHYIPTQDSKTIIVDSDPVWLSDTWKISLFTMLLKLLSYKSVNDLSSPESGYWIQIQSVLPQLLFMININTAIMHGKEFSSKSQRHDRLGVLSNKAEILAQFNSLVKEWNENHPLPKV